MILILLLALFGCVLAENNDVVVLVHGLASDSATWTYIPELEEAGLRTIAVDINPFESNHDRAVSLFAQLKGTQIDYGVCHSEEFNHKRFGADFTGRGLYPEWDENHKIHFVGHSMGGQTIRTLERLLELGSGCDRDIGGNELFQGGKNWITSITTLATPHDGTTAPDQVPFDADEFFFSVLVRFGGSVDQLAFPQFGFVPEEGESKRKYLERVKESDIYIQEDFSFYDLSIAGAAKFNSLGPQVLRNDRYYFSYAAERTSPGKDCVLFLFSCDPVEEADREMSFSLSFTANVIGKQSAPEDRPNDGIVNQNRAKCPGDTSRCKEVPDDLTTWTPGQWHYVNIGYLDHFQITNRDERNDKKNFEESAKRIYMQHGLRLKQLPSTSVRSLPTDEEFRRSEMADDVRRYFEAIDLLTTPFFTPRKKMSDGAAAVLLLFIVGSVFTIGVVIGRKTKASEKFRASIDFFRKKDKAGTPSVVTV